jgi:tRNA threonylcarbamoyladenosine biosynthesis protein TsaB
MNILGIDTSSIVATVAVVTEEKLLAEYIVNNKKNHSEKLMQVLDTVLKDSDLDIDDLDAIAVAKGPGSFTGLRIGMACAQGLAHASGMPIVGVNTLDALAYNMIDVQGLLCPVINAQRQEMYTSLYRWEDGELIRLWDYEITSIRNLAQRLLQKTERVFILGDGVNILWPTVQDCNHIILAPQISLMPRASSVAAAGLQEFLSGKAESCFDLEPFYIRRSHAEEKWEESHGRKSPGCSH